MPPASVNSVYQATFTMRNFLVADLDVTLGRMPVAYGRERVIGVEDWDLATNILFDGAHGRYNFESGWLDYFNFKLQETYDGKYASGSGDDNITGLYMHYDANENFWFEPYAMMMTHENWASPDLDNDRVMAFGGLVDYVQQRPALLRRGRDPDRHDLPARGARPVRAGLVHRPVLRLRQHDRAVHRLRVRLRQRRRRRDARERGLLLALRLAERVPGHHERAGLEQRHGHALRRRLHARREPRRLGRLLPVHRGPRTPASTTRSAASWTSS